MSDPYRRASYQRNRRIVLAESGGICSIPGCRNPATTVDHIQPLALGGWHDLDNLRAMCPSCNSRLGVRITNAKRAAKQLGRQSRRW
jgi:5-methylcytosine-specific restriction endonuclease McrA